MRELGLIVKVVSAGGEGCVYLNFKKIMFFFGNDNVYYPKTMLVVY